MARGQGVSGRVVAEIADSDGVTEEALPPLYESVEPDALDELFDHVSRYEGTELEVEFSYNGYTVIIRDSEDIIVE